MGWYLSYEMFFPCCICACLAESGQYLLFYNACANSTIETLEKVVKYVILNDEDTRTTSMTSFWCLYYYLLSLSLSCEHISQLFLQFIHWLWTINCLLGKGVGNWFLGSIRQIIWGCQWRCSNRWTSDSNTKLGCDIKGK